MNASLGRPGDNATGINFFPQEVMAKAIGFYPVESTPEEFAVRIKVELEKWRT